MEGNPGSASDGVEEDGSCRKIVIRRTKIPIKVVNPKINEIMTL
jgi:hypothetical protein